MPRGTRPAQSIFKGGDGSTSGSTGGSTTGGSTSGGGAATTTDNGKSVRLVSEASNPDGSKTWTYEVCEVSGQDLSNWVLATGSCKILGSSPQSGFELVSPDPNAGLNGVKWNTGGHAGCETYTVTTQGGTRALIKFAAKAPGVSYGVVEGPVCK